MSNNKKEQKGDSPPEFPGQANNGGRPDCPKCGGLGFIVPDVEPEHPHFGRAIECSCRLENHDRARYGRLLRISELGSLADSTFDNFLTEGVDLPDAKRLRLKLVFEAPFEYLGC